MEGGRQVGECCNIDHIEEWKVNVYTHIRGIILEDNFPFALEFIHNFALLNVVKDPRGGHL